MPDLTFLSMSKPNNPVENFNELLKFAQWVSDHPGVLIFYFFFAFFLFIGAIGLAYILISVWIENTSDNLGLEKKITRRFFSFKTQTPLPLSLAAALGVPIMFLLPVHILNHFVESEDTPAVSTVEQEQNKEILTEPVAATSSQPSQMTERSLIVALALQEFLMLFICVVLFAFASAQGSKLKDFGLELPPRLSRAALWGIGSYWCCILAINFIGLFYVLLLFIITGGFNLPENPIETFAREGQGGVLPVALFIVAVVGAPLFEEFIFRGAIYPGLKSRFSRPIAAVISAILFALVHPYTHWAHIFLLGLLFVYLYERTGSLWPSIALHATNNAIAMINLFILLQIK
ncbi:MAG: CPBP family intramembrane glutamic endopeptidase [Planctomycetota bacterium]